MSKKNDALRKPFTADEVVGIVKRLAALESKRYTTATLTSIMKQVFPELREHSNAKVEAAITKMISQ